MAVQTQIRHCRMLHLIRVCTVCFNYRKLRIKWNSLPQFRNIFQPRDSLPISAASALIFCYTPPHSSGGVLWFHVGSPCVRTSIRLTSVCPSVFHFRMITWVNINGFSPNLVCALILWRSGLGLLMGKFCQFLMELSAQDMPIFSFSDCNLSK